ncbi:MAG: YdgA family protein [Betaproteobacteria bacterium]|nr:YdgA family protein [Betaproteobacteria bacterium]
MSISKKKIIGAAVLAAVVSIGGTYWASKSTENRFRESMESVEKIADYGIKVTVLDYQRSFFSATARTEWVLKDTREETEEQSGKKPLTLTFNHSIKHGPLLAFASAARIHSELVPTAEFTNSLVEAFGSDPFDGKTPLTVVSTFGLAGGSHDRFILPKFDASISPKTDDSAETDDSSPKVQTQVSWGGLNGEITTNSSYSKIKTKIELGGLTLAENVQNQPEGNLLQMGRASLQADLAKPSGYENFFIGTLNIAMDKLSFRNTDKDTGEIQSFALENVNTETDTSLKKGGMNTKIRFGANMLQMEGKSQFAIDKLGVTLMYENVDANTVEAISGLAKNAQDEEQRQQELFLVLQKQAEPLLKRKPTFSIKDLNVTTQEGVTKGNLRIAYMGNGDPDQLSPNDLAVDFKFNVPNALLVRLFEDKASESISSLVEEGVLIEKDGILSIDASFKKGALTLNGKQESLEALQGLLR